MSLTHATCSDHHRRVLSTHPLVDGTSPWGAPEPRFPLRNTGQVERARIPSTRYHPFRGRRHQTRPKAMTKAPGALGEPELAVLPPWPAPLVAHSPRLEGRGETGGSPVSALRCRTRQATTGWHTAVSDQHSVLGASRPPFHCNPLQSLWLLGKPELINPSLLSCCDWLGDRRVTRPANQSLSFALRQRLRARVGLAGSHLPVCSETAGGEPSRTGHTEEERARLCDIVDLKSWFGLWIFQSHDPSSSLLASVPVNWAPATCL